VMGLIHRERIFRVKYCSSVEELASDLAKGGWKLAQAWKLENHLFVNDSIYEAGPIDLAVMRIKGQEGNRVICDQLDSINVNIFPADALQEYLNEAIMPEVLPYGEEVIRLEESDPQ